MNRVDRLLALILHLQSRRVVTAMELAGHFELSLRTIYRDIAALGQAGVPIVAEAGVGYSLMKGYHLPPVNFTTAEANAIVAGGLLLKHFADSALTAEMQSAIMKIKAVLPREDQERAFRLEHGMSATAVERPSQQADLSLLQQALADRRLLEFRYRDARIVESSERIVEPVGLIHYLGRWHLIAWCRLRQDYRDFRTDRMTGVVMRRETFAARSEFSVAAYIRSMPAPRLRATVRFTYQVADRARREWWMGVVQEKEVPGGMLLTLATVEWPPLARWLLSFGAEAVIVRPANLRKMLVESAEEAARHHRRSAT